MAIPTDPFKLPKGEESYGIPHKASGRKDAKKGQEGQSIDGLVKSVLKPLEGAANGRAMKKHLSASQQKDIAEVRSNIELIGSMIKEDHAEHIKSVLKEFTAEKLKNDPALKNRMFKKSCHALEVHIPHTYEGAPAFLVSKWAFENQKKELHAKRVELAKAAGVDVKNLDHVSEFKVHIMVADDDIFRAEVSEHFEKMGIKFEPDPILINSLRSQAQSHGTKEASKSERDYLAEGRGLSHPVGRRMEQAGDKALKRAQQRARKEHKENEKEAEMKRILAESRGFREGRIEAQEKYQAKKDAMNAADKQKQQFDIETGR